VGNKILIAVAIAGALIIFAIANTYPLFLVVTVIACLTFFFQRKGQSVALIIICSLLTAAVLAYVTQAVLEIFSTSQPVIPASWFTLKHLYSPANQAGRIGLVLGALAGAVISHFLKRNARHDASHIHGLKVTDSAAKGTSRWASDRDISHVCEFGPPKQGKFGGGIILGRLDNRIVRAQPQKGTPPLPGHVMVAAGTGAGKTYSFVIPNVISGAMTGESMVITDPKGELTCLLAPWLKSKGYDVYVFNLQKPSHGNRWNPVAECRDDEETSAFATAIIHNATKEKASYFTLKEVQLLKASIYLLKADFSPEEAHLRSVLSLLSWPAEKLNERFMEAFKSGKLGRVGLEEWKGAVSSNLENAVSGVTAKLNVIRGESIAKLLTGTPGDMIDMSVIGRKKAVMFCVLPVNSAHLKPVLASFYYFFFRRLYELAAQNEGKLPNPTRFILDEFANIGEIPGFVEVISTARSLGLQIQFILQGLKQLQDVYGTAEAENVLANCPIRLFLGGDDVTTTTYFSRQLGSAAVKAIGESHDVTIPGKKYFELPKKRETTVGRALMEPEELTRLNPMDGVALLRWCLPIYLRKLGWPELPQVTEINELALKSITELVPEKEYELVLPDMPEMQPEKPKTQQRTRAGEKQKKPDLGLDDLLGKEKKEQKEEKEQPE